MAMFGDEFQVNPSLAPASNPTGGTDVSLMGALEKTLANPRFRMLMGGVGASMAPKDFAGQFFNNVYRPAEQSSVIAEAMKKMLGPQTPTTPAAPVEPTVDPAAQAKNMSTAAGVLKKLNALPPNITQGWGDMVKKAADAQPIGAAFATKPELAPNPTIPIGDAIAGQAPIGVPSTVQQPVSPFSFNMSPDLAGALSPEQVMGLYGYGNLQKKQELEIQKQVNENMIAPLMRGETVARTSYLAGAGKLHNVEAMVKEWEQTPEGQNYQLLKITAPTMAAALMEEKKRDFAVESVKKILGDNFNTTVPDFGLSFGQMAQLSAASPHSGDAVAKIWDTYTKVKEAKANHEAINARLKFDKDNQEAEKAMKNLTVLDARLAALIKAPAEKDFPNTPEGKSALQMARLSPQGLRTKEQEAEIIEIQRQRQAMTAKIPGLMYTPIPVSEKPVDIVVTPEQLKKLEKNKTKWQSQGIPSLDIIKMFDKTNTEYRGI